MNIPDIFGGHDFLSSTANSNSNNYCLYSQLNPLSGIEDLCTKRDELQKQILSEEEEKTKIQNDVRILTERLAKINESLARKIASRSEYDKTIAETEAAYMKVCRQLVLTF